MRPSLTRSEKLDVGGSLALVKACKAWTILLLPTALVSVTDPVTATG
ncbi:hypothetical protein R2242_16605 [Proteus mirabilis]|nr:hypothetical protein [Proteus mirabilis]EKU0465374.1 hypothetical protein [Proteus mirabilis]ELB1542405.1 hypothetical protein [Proteus mirabilis]EMD9371232.1 hypothetical protein [Proteus mirabilis]MEA5325290.1 hypothetical protein [Proteus mirabilis]